MNDKNYIKELEDVIKQVIRPIKKIPFHLIIESLFEAKVLDFDLKEKNNKKLLKSLIEICDYAGREVNNNGGIDSKRVNEVGNYIEYFVKKSIENFGFQVSEKTTKMGKKKSTGYPDLQFYDELGRLCFIECKTFNINNINTTQRSFYLSPSVDGKVNNDGFHFVLSFEVEMFSKDKYKCNSYKIIDIRNLTCDLKNEFNSDNKRLYSKNLILHEAKI